MRYAMRAAVLLSAALLARPALAQTPRALTDADYQRAEQFMGYNVNPLVYGASVRPHWLAGDRFWYANDIPQGTEFVLVNPARKTRTRAFDQERVAAALSRAADTTYDAFHLPFDEFDFSADGKAIVFDVGRRRWTCDVQGAGCTGAARPAERVSRNEVVSPDSARAAFIRDDNLWVRYLATGKETQLTTDGVKDFGYATNNAGWIRSDRPVLLWSPDSKKIATFQMDERGVGDMYLAETRVGPPVLEAWKYPLPEDSVIFRIHRVVVNVDPPKVVRLQMPPDQHRSSLCDDVSCGGQWVDVEWSPDASRLFFLSTSRNHQQEHLREADPNTGAGRSILEETAPTFYESGVGKVNWHALPASNPAACPRGRFLVSASAAAISNGTVNSTLR